VGEGDLVVSSAASLRPFDCAQGRVVARAARFVCGLTEVGPQTESPATLFERLLSAVADVDDVQGLVGSSIS
jgi:hypothetical protein